MSTNVNTGVDEREQWRARIMRALAELRGDDVTRGGERRRDDEGDDHQAESTKL
jgi:hypothetical protein